MARILMLGSCAQSPLDDREYLIRRFADEGHRLMVVRPRGVGAAGRGRAPAGVRCETIPGRAGGFDPRRDTTKIHRLRRLFCRHRPEVFVGEGIDATVEGLVAAWLADVSMRWGMVTVPGTVPDDRRDVANLLVQKTASVLYGLAGASGADDRDSAIVHCARRLVGDTEEIAAVDGIGVDLEDYRPTELPETAAFILDARLLTSRGVVEYVEAARRVGAHHPSVKFRLSGWPTGAPRAIGASRLQSWIEDDDIEYLGYLGESHQILAESSVYVAPARDGGISRTALEAMAMGRPVVATDVPGCRRAVDHGQNGFVVDPGDVDGLARAMTHFVDEPELREAMGTKSRQIAAGRFDAGGLVDAVVESLELGTRRVSKPLLPTDV